MDYQWVPGLYSRWTDRSLVCTCKWTDRSPVFFSWTDGSPVDAAIQEKYFRDVIDVWGYGLCVHATLFPRMQSELDSIISVADPGFSAVRRPEVPIIHVANFSEK